MSNSLSKERSPYLRQHKDNPVDWLPWGPEAFYKAEQEDKPVFLSIGYSTCHWCHVMAHESFENDQVAALLNRYFVPVKVDREERPDVDSVYMKVCMALTGSGGWPLTIIMTPDRLPFFAGTYIPRESRHGQPGLIPLLGAIAAKWERDREDLLSTADEVRNFVMKEAPLSPAQPGADKLEAAAQQLCGAYDEEYGGFGTAPKFPSPHDLLFLLRLGYYSKDKKYRQMADNSLRQMYRGGIYDHFGGGFSRYSTDREWLAPHFEKTLYDNALLALVYTEAWQDGHIALYRSVAESTLDYCLRELKGEEGGFYCGQDADSGGVEGAYYLFTPAEVKSVLGEDAGRHFCNCYDITEEGNFQGKSIPNLLLNNRWNFVPEGYEEYRERLRLYREQRMRLGTDDKILTAWNGLMLMALSRAAWAFKDRRYLMEARALADFMAEKLYEEEQLKARYCQGELRFDAQLDDYAFYGLGLLELYRADFEAWRIAAAEVLALEIRSRFADEKGGFFKTASDGEQLFVRPMMEDVYGSRELVFALADEKHPEALEAVLAHYAPELTALKKSPANAALLTELAPFTEGMEPQNGKAAYYICKDGSCSLPVTEL